MVAAGIAVAGFGCGDSDEETTEAVATQAAEPAAAPVPAEAPPQPAPPAKPAGAAETNNGDAAPPATEPDQTGVRCPPVLDREQCAALQKAGNKGGSGRATVDRCPPGLSRSRCRELLREMKAAEGGSGSLDCSQLGQEQCEEILEAIRRG